MPRMKSRDRFPVGEWQCLHPAAGMKAPFKGSFSECVTFETKFRKSNPTICERENLPLDQSAIEDWVDEQNALRMIAGGWFQFVEEGQTFPMQQAGQKKSWLGNAAAKAKTAVAIYRDLFGPDGKTVAPELAEKRGAVCVACPLNQKGGLKNYFIESVASGIQALYGIFRDLNLSTVHDSELGVCRACSCPNRAKIWTPIQYIEAHMEKETWQNLDQSCWMLKERAGS